ncbi:SulP family inorganic anion transporter [Lentisphaerota bacterium ZTH]|nr:SulP family inorganic anion transporter [Lentisphaerota bacterium]WET05736.1 SulP family inorganic anion transporter [Lentisphaerota bacterium ZTH]
MFKVKKFKLSNGKNDFLSGLTVALALVPEAIAFAFVCNVSPLTGLYAAFIVGLVTSVLGGRPGMISGATGAVAVVLASLVIGHGVEYLFAAVLLMGMLQLLAGIFRLGKFVRLIPHPVMLGFVNGLAIVIFLAQLSQFKNGIGATATWMSGIDLWVMLGMVALTMLICFILPKLTRAVPASLVAIIVVTMLAAGLNYTGIYHCRTVMDFVKMLDPGIQTLKGGLPMFHLPQVPFTLETLKIIFPYSLLAASVGLIESLLTLTLVDEITETRGQGNRECLGQGAANLLCGLFGAMGGCAMIGQSMINIKSGGRGRLSGITAAVGLIAFVVVGARFIQAVPVAALTGVMFMVVISTFEWSSIRIMHKIPRADAFIIVLVSAITVVEDLAVAVLAGVIVSALVFAWKKGSRIEIHAETDQKGSKVYHLSGPLFFGSARNFSELFNPATDPGDVIIDFHNSRVHDHSGIEAINALAERYTRLGKTLHLIDLSPECARLLDIAGDMVEVKVYEDLQAWHIATDRLG